MLGMLLLAKPWEVFAMNAAGSRAPFRPAVLRKSFAVTVFLSGVIGASGVLADDGGIFFFRPGNLLLSRSVYDNNPANVIAGTTQLPPNCIAPNCVTGESFSVLRTARFAEVLRGVSFTPGTDPDHDRFADADRDHR